MDDFDTWLNGTDPWYDPNNLYIDPGTVDNSTNTNNTGNDMNFGDMTDAEFDAYLESLGLDTSGGAPLATGDQPASAGGFWDSLTNAFGNVAGTALTTAEKNALNLLQSKTTRTPAETAALQKIEKDQQTNTLITVGVLLVGGLLAYKYFAK